MLLAFSSSLAIFIIAAIGPPKREKKMTLPKEALKYAEAILKQEADKRPGTEVNLAWKGWIK